jgi:hypothetical protein
MFLQDLNQHDNIIKWVAAGKSSCLILRMLQGASFPPPSLPHVHEGSPQPTMRFWLQASERPEGGE